MRVTLLERGGRLLPGFHPALGAYALKTLRSQGVDVRLGTDVAEVDGAGGTIGGGQRIPAATVVWAGGVDAPPWVKPLGLALRHGQVVTGADLRVPGHPDTFAVGDLAAVPGADGLRPHPGRPCSPHRPPRLGHVGIPAPDLPARHAQPDDRRDEIPVVALVPRKHPPHLDRTRCTGMVGGPFLPGWDPGR